MSHSGEHGVQSAAQLSDYPMAELLGAVLERQDELLTEDGFLTKDAFLLADLLGIRVCVDGAPVRASDDKGVEMMAIRRNTGPYAGKLCLVGGGVGRVKRGDKWVPESIEEALSRHFSRDLGFGIRPLNSWQRPDDRAQDMRPVDGEVRNGFTPNPDSRHLVALRYLVQIIDGEDRPTFGSTKVGGQEAIGIEWFTEDEMPDQAEFGYGHGQTYRALWPIASEILG